VNGPAKAADRAVPGHWEGDLLIGKENRSAIGTLAERTSRYCLLMHLPHGYDAPNGYDAAAVRDAMIPVIHTLPQLLKRSLTWIGAPSWSGTPRSPWPPTWPATSPTPTHPW
jgi:transposase, IS30 family